MSTNPPINNDKELLDALDLETEVPVNDKMQPDTTKILDRREPEVVAPPPPTPQPAEDRMTAALRTIEEQNQRIANLESGLRTAQQPQPQYRQVEPQVEFEEVFPGRRVPKNSAHRPIRLTEEDLIRMQWNENPARAIETLANAFLGYIVDAIPQITMNQFDQRTNLAQEAWARKTYFHQQFPDLQPHETFVAMLEAEAQRAGFLTPNGKTQEVYNREVAGLARQRIAAMRGISVDQYMATVSSPQRPPTTSRAIGTGGSGRAPRTPPQGEGDRYFDDL